MRNIVARATIKVSEKPSMLDSDFGLPNPLTNRLKI